MDPNRTGGPKNRWLIFKWDTGEEWICKLPDPVASWLVAVGETLRRRVCSAWGGHAPVDDQCCKPEHRFCAYCQKLTPNAEVARGFRSREIT